MVELQVAGHLLIGSQSPPTGSGVADIGFGVGTNHGLTSPTEEQESMYTW